MRRTILSLMAIFSAPAAGIASTAGGELIGDDAFQAAAASIQKPQIAPGGVAASGQRDFYIILAKGDKSGTGPGAGGHKGQKKGGGHGKQKEGGQGQGHQKQDKS